jgi:plasmid stability protein
MAVNLKVRVPARYARALQIRAAARMLTVSDIVREILTAHLTAEEK